MTTEPDYSNIKILVPEGKNVTDLNVGELDIASRHLQADVLECFTGAVPGKRWAALIECAVLWAKRGGDVKAKPEDFRSYEVEELQAALRMHGDEEETPDPTGSDDEPSESP